MTTDPPTTESPTDLDAPPNGAEAARELREVLRELKRQRIIVLVLAASLTAVVVIGGLYLGGKARDATLDRKALCALRADLQARVGSSKDFLIDHPRGVAGIDRPTIEKSIRDQQRTIVALASLPCPPARAVRP